jgi:tetratricopeptide (TPR) repeat protein
MVRAIVLAFLAGALASPAVAQSSEDLAVCKSDEGTHPPSVVIDACTRAIASNSLSNSDLGVAYVNRGNALDDSGDQQGALADYSRALALNSSDAFIYLNRGVLYQNSGHPTEALSDFNESLRLLPDHPRLFDSSLITRKPIYIAARPII